MEKLSRLQKERNFHDNRFGGDDSERTAAVKYYLVKDKGTQTLII